MRVDLDASTVKTGLYAQERWICEWSDKGDHGDWMRNLPGQCVGAVPAVGAGDSTSSLFLHSEHHSTLEASKTPAYSSVRLGSGVEGAPFLPPRTTAGWWDDQDYVRRERRYWRRSRKCTVSVEISGRTAFLVNLREFRANPNSISVNQVWLQIIWYAPTYPSFPAQRRRCVRRVRSWRRRPSYRSGLLSSLRCPPLRFSAISQAKSWPSFVARRGHGLRFKRQKQGVGVLMRGPP
ncbi:hypothetical protein B0H19DRAFT_285063 [Mycena capillaripes]|nr:hypothetical protein B0H19DRAFT_285063 [Mycena capillaripes]